MPASLTPPTTDEQIRALLCGGEAVESLVRRALGRPKVSARDRLALVDWYLLLLGSTLPVRSQEDSPGPSVTDDCGSPLPAAARLDRLLAK